MQYPPREAGGPPRPPLSPEASAVLKSVGQHPGANGAQPGGVHTHRAPRRVSRRGLLLGAVGLGAAAVGGRALVEWDPDIPPWGKAEAAAPICLADDVSATEKVLSFNNWPLYIDVSEDEKTRPSLDEFVKRSGIKVTYKEEINDNIEFLTKFEPALAACQPAGDDIIVLTDWASARLVRQGYARKLDLTRIPNVEANLLPNLRIRTWDKTREYAVPWQSGLAGIAYNGTVSKAVNTVEELLTRPDLKGKVTLLAEMRDTMGLLMQSLGYNANEFSEAHFDEALSQLAKAVGDGQIKAFTGNEYAESLGKGDIAACMAWSGDVVQLKFEDDKIQFVVPESGAILFSDNMQVPVTATHGSNALNLMNYYYEPEVAAEVAAWVNYICPVAGAHSEMEKLDPELAANPLIFPEPEVLALTKNFMAVSADEEKRYEDKFQQVVATLGKK